ncbi:MAG: magnesium transporter [Bacteroidetes bacterium]|jgi:magnesium transporter|nr:magnesium transporter [Bacteroidota bacterium]MDA0972164.1 magnesium transporter [Bacteroidota bacterium]
MAQTKINKDFILTVKLAMERMDLGFLRSTLADLHPADIAEVMDGVDMDDAKSLYRLLEDELAAEVMMELEEDVREEFLSALSSKEIAEQVIENIDTDDAVDLLGELSDEKKAEVISHIEDPEHASDLVQLLNYEEDTAGALMATELVKVNVDWTVTRAVRAMRKQGEEVDEVYTVYVVDDHETLLGSLSFKRLFFSASSMQSTIRDLFEAQELRSVTPDTPAEEVVKLMKKYDLVVIPVVNEAGRLLGRITIDDVVDYMQEEAERDYAMASGISQKVESDDSVWLLTRARLPWLIIGLVGGVLVAQVISLYEHQLQLDPKLAFFIPLIAAMGGNVGVQSSAIVVQGLANQSIDLSNILGRLVKEIGVALVNGAVCALLLLAFNLLFSDTLALSYTVSLALFCVIMIAGLFGTFIPIALNRFNVDPALATGPFITTLNDILGLFIYFWIGQFMYAL